jgi:hypothetical protein
MAPPRPEPLLGALGVVGGAAGVVAARCGGGACSACFACAVPALGLVIAALVTGRRPRQADAPPCGPARAGDAAS